MLALCYLSKIFAIFLLLLFLVKWNVVSYGEMLVDQCHVSGLCAESIIKWPCAATTRSTCVSCDHVCIGHIKLIFW